MVPLPVDPVDDRGAKYQESVQSSLQHIDQVDRLDAGTFFKRVASVMKENPPAQHDAPALEGLKKLGIEPGKEFNIMQNVNGWMQPSEL